MNSTVWLIIAGLALTGLVLFGANVAAPDQYAEFEEMAAHGEIAEGMPYNLVVVAWGEPNGCDTRPAPSYANLSGMDEVWTCTWDGGIVYLKGNPAQYRESPLGEQSEWLTGMRVTRIDYATP